MTPVVCVTVTHRWTYEELGVGGGGIEVSSQGEKKVQAPPESRAPSGEGLVPLQTASRAGTRPLEYVTRACGIGPCVLRFGRRLRGHAEIPILVKVSISLQCSAFHHRMPPAPQPHRPCMAMSSHVPIASTCSGPRGTQIYTNPTSLPLLWLTHSLCCAMKQGLM